MGVTSVEENAQKDVFSSGYEWNFFPHFVIRSTGFPFEWLENLAFDKTNQVIREIIQTEQTLDQLARSLDAFWEPNGSVPRKVKQKLLKWVHRHEGGLTMKLAELDMEDKTALLVWAAQWDRLANEYADRVAHLQDVYAQEMSEKRQKLHQVVGDRKYQEAVYLSSPDMYKNNVAKYLEVNDFQERNSEVKRMERRFFHYLQRLCGKNETSSFFGPLNYGNIDERQDHHLQAEFQAGDIIKQRGVFLSFWAVKSLTEAIKRDDVLRAALPLRLHPMVEVVPAQGVLHLHNNGRTVKVGTRLARALHNLAGRDSLEAVLAACSDMERPQAQKLLGSLLQAGLLKQELQVPSTMGNALPYVIEQLELLPESESKRVWLDRLRGWSKWLERMASEQDLTDRIALIGEGERCFEEQTGEHARRGGGNFYTDRYIYYEETRGHVEQFEMGKKFHDKMCTDLRPALELSAFYGYTQWQHAQQRGKELFANLSPTGEAIPYYTFLNALREKYPLSFDDAKAPEIAQIEELVRNKAIENPRCVTLSGAELPIREVEMPLYSLPDLFFASPSVEAMAQGDFQVVLGKLHSHLLVPNWMTVFYPEEERLQADLRRELDETPEFRQLVYPEVIRRNKGFYNFQGRAMEFSESSSKPSEDVIPMYDLEVLVQADGTLGLRHVKTQEPVLLYIQLADQVNYPPFMLFALPGLTHLPISTGTHTPRIVIGQAVYQRERWEFESAQLTELLSSKQSVDHFVNIVRFQEEHGLPDVVYVRGLSERKPYLIDFRNYFCVEMLRTILSNNERLLIEEMLPTPEQLWLQSDAGRYSCEFRMNVFKKETQTRGGTTC